jgi:hypothetical protein
LGFGDVPKKELVSQSVSVARNAFPYDTSGSVFLKSLRQ